MESFRKHRPENAGEMEISPHSRTPGVTFPANEKHMVLKCARDPTFFKEAAETIWRLAKTSIEVHFVLLINRPRNRIFSFILVEKER